MDEIPLSTLLISLVVLLVVSAFFSISETSMMALNRYRLRHLTKTGHRGARLASLLLSKVDRLLGVVLLGNTLVNAGATTLATVIAIRLFGGGELVLSLSTAAVAFLLLVFSEITPKVIGATRPEMIAFPASYILTPLLTIAYPITWFVNLFVRGLLWLMRFQPHSNQAHTFSMEELRTLILEGGNFLPQKHQNILLNLFDLESITVEDAMTAAVRAATCSTSSDRLTCWSPRPRLAAKPELVVARATKPRCCKILAEPTSHGLGSRKVPCSCSRRNASRAGVVMAPSWTAGRNSRC